MAEILRSEGPSLAHGSRRVRRDMQSRRRRVKLLTLALTLALALC